MLTQPAALPHLHTVFDRQDIIRALAHTPARTYRKRQLISRRTVGADQPRETRAQIELGESVVMARRGRGSPEDPAA